MKMDKIPNHVAVIMDGNGRWAKKKFLPRVAGHTAGVETLREIIKYSSDIGIKYLTVYAFSTENWGRPEKEVEGLMKLLVKYFDKELENLFKNNVIIKLLGEKESIPEKIRKVFDSAEEKTSVNSGLQFNIAFNYGSRNEMISAIKSIASECLNGEISVEDIDEKIFESKLYTAGIPDPDLMIRTSGEIRMSNFLLWQLSYSELYFTKVFWPDFKVKEYKKALEEYNNRQRRYGKI